MRRPSLTRGESAWLCVIAAVSALPWTSALFWLAVPLIVASPLPLAWALGALASGSLAGRLAPAFEPLAAILLERPPIARAAGTLAELPFLALFGLERSGVLAACLVASCLLSLLPLARRIARPEFHRPRRRGRLLAAGAGALSLAVLGAPIAKSLLEATASKRLGTEVRASRLTLSPGSGEVVLEGVTVADPALPSHHLLELETVRLRIEIAPILRGRLWIPEASIEGILLGTDRDTTDRPLSARPTDADPARPIGEALLPARVALNEHYLDRLVRALSHRRELPPLETPVERREAKREAEESVAELRATWVDRERRLPSSVEIDRARHEGNLARLASYRETLAREVRQRRAETLDLRRSLSAITAASRRDADELWHREFPTGTAGDCTAAVAGPKLLNAVERSLGLFSRLLPRAPKELSVGGTRVGLFRGRGATWVEAGDEGSLPRIWIGRVAFASRSRGSARHAELTAEVRDLSSFPARLGRGFRAWARADAPGIGLRGARGEASGPLGADGETRFALAVDSLEVRDWALKRSPELEVRVKDAIASLRFEASLTPASLRISVSARAARGTIAAESRSPEITQAFACADRSPLALEGSLEGPWSGVALEMRGPFGRKLGKCLERAAEPLEHARAALREREAREAAAARKEIEAQLSALEARHLAPLVEREASLAPSPRAGL